MSSQDLKDQLKTGTTLKSTTTNDKSQPLIEKDVKIQKNNHDQLLKEVSNPPSLTPTTTADRSNPVIDSSAHISANGRNALLNDIKNHATTTA
ncbi:actobindin [Heterostelium album PN500]|uniref:Actobindin n=1 Tax=Heterostelium pallidum (strain ATCC 26659 / Pp 5 / PN500) TaxID=670386 RepID=D3BE23_HETP5|nr:actobindin [Heterostelium album PN500]EFA80154.1 actobindin [Heterostelium album PN500]|eukprot:XP_020432274.1 actobindin [Heterostelium album PN500]